MGPTDKPTAVVYIDGFNLYYGALKARPHLRWLDLEALANLLIPDGHELLSVRYFTAAVPDTPSNPLAAKRQATYWKALRSTPKVQLKLGHVAVRKRSARLADGSGFAPILHREEKGSDVNLATAMLVDHFLLVPDISIVVSDDTDLEAPVALARSRGHVVQIVSPRGMQLERLGWPKHRARKLKQSLLALAQLPDVVKTNDGGTATRPEAWK